MRIAIGSLAQVTDSAVSPLTQMEAFTGQVFLRDRGILDGAAPPEVAGFIAALQAVGADIVPLIVAEAPPGGPLMRETFHVLAIELVHRLAARKPVDGVLLSLGGRMAVEDEADAAGELLERVRNVLPPGLPIGVALGEGAVITARMRQPGVFFVVGESTALDTGTRTALRLLAPRSEEPS